MTALAPEAVPEDALARFGKFEDVLRLLENARVGTLLVEAKQNMRIAKFAPGRIEFQPWDNAASDLAGRLADKLRNLTGVRWVVSIGDAPEDARTAYETENAEKIALEKTVRDGALVAKVFELFPTASIKSVRSPEQRQQAALEDALDEAEEWDPFEEE